MIRNIDNFSFEDQKVMIRVDFNVPLDERRITDDLRIVESLPTIDKVINDGGIPIILSHLGRPKGTWVKKFSLEPVAEYMEEKWGYNIIFAQDCLGKAPQDAVEKAKAGDVILLENLRFYNYETANDLEFAKIMRPLADSYINDAFGTVHRHHSSVYELPKLFENRFAGKSLSWEIEYLDNAIKNAKHPYVAVVGGAKISDKIDVIKQLIDTCDTVLIGGGMMFTFLKALGKEIGRSIFEEDKIELAKELMEYAKNQNVKLLIPVDVVVADQFAKHANHKTVTSDNIPSDWLGMDIGEETREMFAAEIAKAQTVVWNGPMGVFEMAAFAKGTYAVSNALANVTAKGATTIIGGGDSAAAIKKMNFMNKVTHVTPGGGAWLKFMEGKILPGIEALEY